jgi:hypothetical protein
MNLWEWFNKVLSKRELAQVPTYRFGDFNRDELIVLNAALELLTLKQMESQRNFGDDIYPLIREHYYNTARLYREVLAAQDQLSRDAFRQDIE